MHSRFFQASFSVVLVLCLAGALLSFAEEKIKPEQRRTPDECLAALVKASKEGDDAAALACYSESRQNIILTMAAFRVEQELFFRTKHQDEAQEILKDAEVDDFDIMGELQLNEQLALQKVGGSIANKAAFLKAARVLIEKKDSVATRQSNALPKGADILGLRINAQVTLKNVKVDAETAKGQLAQSKDVPSVEMTFRKLASGWVIGLPEEPQRLPWFTKAQRVAMEKLRAKWQLRGEDKEPARGMTTAISTFTGRHPTEIPELVLFPTLEVIYIERSELTADDIAILARLPKLKHLNLTGTVFPEEAIAYLQKLSQLETLSVINSGVSEKAVSELKTALRKTRISAGFRTGLTFASEKSREELTQSGNTVLVYIQSAMPFDAKDPVFDNVLNDPGVARLIWHNKVECFGIETEADGTVGEFDKADWLAKPAPPQIAIFAPKAKVPVILSGEKLGKDELLKALVKAGPSQKTNKPADDK